MMAKGCLPHVILTSRDYLLLQSLYGFKLLSFSQIARLHFKNLALPTVINRLSKLERAGFISRYKVPRIFVLGQKNLVSVVYQITRLGISFLQKRQTDLELWAEPLKLQPYSIDHDLLLVDILTTEFFKGVGNKVVLGEHFLRTISHQGLKPDAVLFKSNAQKPTAIELELTAKSEKRYRELVLKYRLSSDFDRVLYVTSSLQIEAKLKSVIGPTDVSNRFEFLNVTDILKIKSGSKSFLDISV